MLRFRAYFYSLACALLTPSCLAMKDGDAAERSLLQGVLFSGYKPSSQQWSILASVSCIWTAVVVVSMLLCFMRVKSHNRLFFQNLQSLPSGNSIKDSKVIVFPRSLECTLLLLLVCALLAISQSWNLFFYSALLLLRDKASFFVTVFLVLFCSCVYKWWCWKISLTVMSDGASLVYTSVKEMKNLDILYKYLVHRLYGFPFHCPAQVVEKDAVFM